MEYENAVVEKLWADAKRLKSKQSKQHLDYGLTFVNGMGYSIDRLLERVKRQ
jgi:hypothetical protein